MNTNVASALAYIFPVNVLWLVLEPYKNDRTIKFHAMQSLGLMIVCIALQVLAFPVSMMGLGIVVAPLFLAIFVLWILCVVKAFQGDAFRIPVLADQVDKMNV